MINSNIGVYKLNPEYLLFPQSHLIEIATLAISCVSFQGFSMSIQYLYSFIYSIAALPLIIATSHKWLLNSWNVACLNWDILWV